MVTNGTVVTMDANATRDSGRRRGDRRRGHRRRRDRAGSARAGSSPRETHRRARPGRPAGPDQHPHARADGPLPRARRRPGADGLAQQVHLPGEKATVSPEFVRVGTRLAALEMIESGTTTFVDMYYFEERSRASRRKPACAASWDRRVIQFPGRGREDAGRRRWRAPRRSSSSGRTTS